MPDPARRESPNRLRRWRIRMPGRADNGAGDGDEVAAANERRNDRTQTRDPVRRAPPRRRPSAQRLPERLATSRNPLAGAVGAVGADPPAVRASPPPRRRRLTRNGPALFLIGPTRWAQGPRRRRRRESKPNRALRRNIRASWRAAEGADGAADGGVADERNRRLKPSQRLRRTKPRSRNRPKIAPRRRLRRKKRVKAGFRRRSARCVTFRR